MKSGDAPFKLFDLDLSPALCSEEREEEPLPGPLLRGEGGRTSPRPFAQRRGRKNLSPALCSEEREEEPLPGPLLRGEGGRDLSPALS